MAAPEGPRRFSCPPDFSAAPFCPDPPFSAEALRGPSKQLWLIRAPAGFSPESLDGHLVPLLGLSALKVLQPDGTQKVFGIQRTSEDLSGPRLLVSSGQADHLTCAHPFSGSLSICERYGGPTGGLQPLSPVAGRPAPQIPAGLKQRFLPFGSHPTRALLPTVAAEPPRKKKKKKKKQHSEAPLLWGEAGGGEAEARCQPKEEGAALWAIEPLAEAQPYSAAFAQESVLSGEAGETSPRSKRKKKKRKENREVKQETGAEGPQDSWLEGNSEPGVGEGSLPGMGEVAQQTHQGIKQETEATTELLTSKEEAAGELWGFSGLVATPEGELGLATEGPGVAGPTHRAKKKKKKKPEEAGQEQEGQPAQCNLGALEQEPGRRAQLGTPPEGGGGREAEPGLGGPSLSHKRKKKRRRCEAAEEGLAQPEQTSGHS